MNQRYFKIAYLCASACLTMAACAPSHDDEPPAAPQEPTVPPVTSQFGLERQDVLDYFSNALKGTTDPFDTAEAIAPEDIDKAQAYVWDLWQHQCAAHKVRSYPPCHHTTSSTIGTTSPRPTPSGKYPKAT